MVFMVEDDRLSFGDFPEFALGLYRVVFTDWLHNFADFPCSSAAIPLLLKQYAGITFNGAAGIMEQSHSWLSTLCKGSQPFALGLYRVVFTDWLHK